MEKKEEYILFEELKSLVRANETEEIIPLLKEITKDYILYDFAKTALKFETAMVELDFDTLRLLKNNKNYDKFLDLFSYLIPEELKEDDKRNFYIILDEEKLLPSNFNFLYLYRQAYKNTKFPFITLKYFLDKGYDINVTDSNGRNTLVYISPIKKRVSLLLFLLENGININNQDINKVTVLHFVVLDSFKGKNVYNFFKLLLDFGADIYLENKEGVSVYSFITEGYEDLLRETIILEEGKLDEREMAERIQERTEFQFKRVQKLIFDYIDARKIRVKGKLMESGKMIKPLTNIVTDYL